MDVLLRVIFIYLFLLIVFRISGKRTLAQITTFDFVLLLIIGEATQQALLGDDYSLINAGAVILALVSFDILFSLIKRRMPKVEKWADGTPIIILKDGKLIQEYAKKARVDESDILEAARSSHGLERVDQIRYAILEKSGGISVIPKSQK